MQKIRREKVNQAIELLWSEKQERTTRKRKIEEAEKAQDVSAQCKIMHCYKRSERQYSMCFSKHRILSEMKSHVTQKNWSTVRNLFLLLLHFSIDLEPLIWRYNFILTLYSNIDNLSNVSQFFQMCIGCLHSDRDLMLQNLLLLSHNKK
ncbi:uncharacterized protein LOC100883514 [Megachile rotundata]|uniref:uncharacterized protein LOC100883514 n=1 Tax=Megachile rotundata TaxID=143995 RepID=UPI000614E86A|nr:PREDICTED: uncharacterized protein LOC100883514 [Megachile rotundata]